MALLAVACTPPQHAFSNRGLGLRACNHPAPRILTPLSHELQSRPPHVANRHGSLSGKIKKPLLNYNRDLGIQSMVGTALTLALVLGSLLWELG